MIYINAYSSLSTLGDNHQTIVKNLTEGSHELLTKRSDLLINEQTSYFGCIKKEDINISSFTDHDSLNNRVLIQNLKKLEPFLSEFLSKFNKDRVGIVLGTSTSGLEETQIELANFKETGVHSDKFKFQMQEFGDNSQFLKEYLNVSGPAFTVSTACSSSARALISARRMIEADLADVVIAGGTDTLSSIPVNGFNAMGVLSSDYCRPFCTSRSGINIGEASGLMILSKVKSNLFLAGTGESSDAYHVSSPDPSGEGAINAMSMALKDAALNPEDIGYINLHGTGTRLNDAMESKAVASIFKDTVPCSSTKYLTGHTLGAAGILEAIILCELLENHCSLPLQDFTLDTIDESLEKCGLIQDKIKTDKQFMMSNSFAFGGNNASIIIGASY